MKLTTRRLAVIGMLGGISVLLGATPLGFIPVGPAKATIMHIPVIIGSIVEGPVVGLFIGLIFGGFSMFQAAVMPTSPVQIVFLDPVVAVIPRMLIALTSYYAYVGIRKVYQPLGTSNRGAVVASMCAAAVGTLTNTAGVLSMIYFRHAAEFAAKLPPELSLTAENVGKFIIYGIAIPNGVPEVIIAVLVVTAVLHALRKIYKRDF